MTFEELYQQIQGMTPEQRTMPVMWGDDVDAGLVTELEIMADDMIDPSGTGLEAISDYQPGGRFYDAENPHDDERILLKRGQGLLLCAPPRPPHAE